MRQRETFALKPSHSANNTVTQADSDPSDRIYLCLKD